MIKSHPHHHHHQQMHRELNDECQLHRTFANKRNIIMDMLVLIQLTLLHNPIHKRDISQLIQK